jgi:hypothetical protein
MLFILTYEVRYAFPMKYFRLVFSRCLFGSSCLIYALIGMYCHILVSYRLYESNWCVLYEAETAYPSGAHEFTSLVIISLWFVYSWLHLRCSLIFKIRPDRLRRRPHIICQKRWYLIKLSLHNLYVYLELVPSTVIVLTELICWCTGYSNKAMLLLGWGYRCKHYTVVITICLTVTKCSYLKWQWIFHHLRRCFLSSITAKTFTRLNCIYR